MVTKVTDSKYLELKNIDKEFKLINKTKKKIIDNFSFSFSQRGLYSFIGSSGCGKTTLLNIISGLDKPTSGELLFDKKSVFKVGNDFLNKYKSSVVSVIFQDYNLFNDFNVVDNLRLCQTKEISDDEIKNVLEKVNLVDYEKRIVNTLSGGEKQRVAIARSILKETPIIVFDEPTGNLDEKNTTIIFDIIKELSKTKLIIVVSHDILIIKKYGDVIYDLENHKYIKEINNDEENSDPYKVEKCNYYASRLGFKNSFKYIFSINKNSLIFNIAIFILLVGQFLLFANIFSLTFYDTTDAYTQTMKNNSWYLLNVQKTVDNVDYNYYLNKYEGPGFDEHEDTTEYYEKLNNKIEKKLPIEKSYFYNINFNNYIEDKSLEMPTADRFEIYEPYNFMKVLTVTDFNKFYEPIYLGSKPKNEKEILIYDYIADYLYEYGIIGENKVGEILHDYIYDIDLKIVGIIKSNYKDYKSIIYDTNLTYYDKKYALSRLDDLKKIICSPETFNYLKNNNTNYYNYLSASINYKDNIYKIDSKIRYVTNYDLDVDYSFDYILNYKSGEIKTSRNIQAFVITKKLAMKIANITDENEFDNSTFGTEYKGSEAFLRSFSIETTSFQFDKSDYPELVYDNIRSQFLGVLDSTYDEEVFYIGTPYNPYHPFSFDKYTILLSSNWKTNKEVISKLQFPKTKSDAFYQSQSREWYEEDFAIYFGYNTFITESEFYLEDVKELSSTIAYILFGVTLISVYIVSIVAVKSSLYKIGILESLGISKYKIFSLYFLNSFILVFLSFLTSIPFSFILMSSINNIFTESIAVNLFFFGIKGISLLITLSFGLLVVLISLIHPLIILLRKSTIQVINENK